MRKAACSIPASTFATGIAAGACSEPSSATRMIGSLMDHPVFSTLSATFRKRELMPSAAPLKPHREAAPAGRQVRAMLRLLVGKTQAGKAEHRGLP